MTCSNQTSSFPFWINAAFPVFFLFFSSFSALGQIDSLTHLAASFPEGKEKIELWADIANFYLDLDHEKVLLYSDSIINASAEIEYFTGLSKALFYKAYADNINGDNVAALSKLKEAENFLQQAKDTLSNIDLYNLRGHVYLEMEMYEQASKEFIRTNKLAELVGDQQLVVFTLANLGSMFYETGNYPLAEKYFKNVLSIQEENNDFGMHGGLYDALANCTAELQSPQAALPLYAKALQHAQQEEDIATLHLIYNNLGATYQSMRDFENAASCYHKALYYSKIIEEQYDIAMAYGNLSGLYLERQQVDSFLDYNKKSFDIILPNSYIDLELEGRNALSEYYASIGQMDSAYANQQRVLEIRNSIYQEDVQRQVQINADQFQLERKEKQLAEQELQLAQAANNRNRLIIFGILLLAIIAAIYQWYLARQRRRKQLAEFALAQQQAEADRLRELDQAKSNFFTNISHELRTPLSLILGPLSDVLREVKAIPIKDKLHTIQRNGQKLLDLVNEIMDLSKLEAGKLELQNTNVDLLPYIKRIWGSFESLAATRRIKMHLDIAVEEVSVLLDRDKFEKILNNLLSNAIKFTPADGFIRLRISKKAGLYHFEVKDTGSGIADDDQQKIFDRFFQAEHGKAQQGGTGVGLALAKELAKLMDGDIQVNSALKEGSTFTFSLPLTEADTKTITQETATEEEQTAPIVFSPLSIQGQKPKVLVVEDHPEMGKYLIQSLGEQYDCILATDGLQALHQLKIHQFDAITSDVMMPNMDGFELRKKINENPVWKHIPFLLLTARHLESDKIKGFQLGVDDYVTKPFSNLELQARLHNLISNKIERDKFMAAEFNAVDQNPTENVDQKFLKEVETEILRNLDREQYSVEDLAKAIGYSSKQLSRILKKLTGLTTVNFILEVRLQKARTLLENRLVATVSEAQYEVGISSTSYFTRKFTERFGKNPRDLL
jgi:signal transduction histidine kinase/DNA-binding response OmpR family regulator